MTKKDDFSLFTGSSTIVSRKETIIEKTTFRAMFLGLVPLFVIAHTGHHIVSALLTPLLPFIRSDFSLDYTRVGMLVSAYSLAYGVSQLPAGWLADRIGPRIVLTCGVSGVALAGIIAGLSPYYSLLAGMLILMGIMGGGYHPAASPLVSAAVETRYRGRALGIHQVGGSLSFFSAPLIAAGLTAVLGWRGTFLAVSIPTFIFGIIFYLLLGRLDNGRDSKKSPGESTETEDGSAFDTRRRMSAVLICGITVMVSLYSTISFIPLYLVDAFGISGEKAAAMLALCLSGGLWAGPLAGFVSDRIQRKVPVILAAGLIGGPAVFMMNVIPYGWVFFGLLMIVGMSQNLNLPIVEAYVISNTSRKRRSTILGIYYFGSRGGTGVAAPIIGLLIDRYGFYASFTLVAVTIVTVTIVCGIFMRRS
ncbi:MAG: MFS transporter [Desulfatiglandaceae bacterium]